MRGNKKTIRERRLCNKTDIKSKYCVPRSSSCLPIAWSLNGTLSSPPHFLSLTCLTVLSTAPFDGTFDGSLTAPFFLLRSTWTSFRSRTRCLRAPGALPPGRRPDRWGASCGSRGSRWRNRAHHFRTAKPT